jgi:predicted acylesterase/phospholipase RssA
MPETRVLPEKRCDLVMKGGITSGVVYPMAVVELAKEYRFECIGGTSAGAIAAVVTAAAEYGRESGGFERIAKLPDELSSTLIEKFHPTPPMRGLFRLMLAVLSGRPSRVFLSWLSGYWQAALGGAVAGFVVLVAFGYMGQSWGFAVLGVLMMALGALVGSVLAVIRQVVRDLPRQDFGLCPGLTQPGTPGEALTDWLCCTIDNVAGLAPGQGPLTIRQLRDRGITVQPVTTDLTSRRPFALPMESNVYAFSRAEFLRLFPEYIVQHMVKHTSPVDAYWKDEKADLFYFDSDDLPAVVLARMSLSFPGLISAIPLHRIDYTFATPAARRCLFSDGGISSNFPVHFFDQFLPHTPTFGISLDDLDVRRVSSDDPTKGRIALPVAAKQGQLLPTRDITGVLSFVMAMFNSAKDWQDSMQSILPGYRERIVKVSLDTHEGGLNLEMPSERINLLTDLGTKAGLEIVARFDLNEHRWRRYLVEIRALDEALRRFAESYDNAHVQPGSLTYAKIATDYQPQSFQKLSQPQRTQLRVKAECIAMAGRMLAELPPVADIEDRMPRSRSHLRNIARMDF